jgi:hypothetical protein
MCGKRKNVIAARGGLLFSAELTCSPARLALPLECESATGTLLMIIASKRVTKRETTTGNLIDVMNIKTHFQANHIGIGRQFKPTLSSAYCASWSAHQRRI